MPRTTKSYKNCQSCGMPMHRDKKGGGRNADGSKNLMYCSHCYEAGKFTLPRISVIEMQDRVKTKMKEMGIPGFVAKLFTRKIPKLARWNSTS